MLKWGGTRTQANYLAPGGRRAPGKMHRTERDSNGGVGNNNMAVEPPMVPLPSSQQGQQYITFDRSMYLSSNPPGKNQIS
jgi:hypothetical protein